MADNSKPAKKESAQLVTDSLKIQRNYNKEPTKTQDQSRPVQLYFSQMLYRPTQKEKKDE